MSDDHDKTAPADPPTDEDEIMTVQVQMDAASRQALAELVAPVTMYSRQQGMPDPGLGDVIGLALRLMHNTVFSQAHETAAQGRGSPTAH